VKATVAEILMDSTLSVPAKNAQEATEKE